MANKISKNSNFVALSTADENGTRKVFTGYTAADIMTAIVSFDAEYFIAETSLGEILLGSSILNPVFAESVRLNPEYKRCTKCRGEGCKECKETGISGPFVDNMNTTSSVSTVVPVAIPVSPVSTPASSSFVSTLAPVSHLLPKPTFKEAIEVNWVETKAGTQGAFNF